jgi:hypothetical protein
MAQTWFLGLAPLPELRSGFLLSAPLSRLGLGKKNCAAFLLRSCHRRRRCFCAIVVAMGSSLTSSCPVLVLQCLVLFNSTNYHNWVPRMCLHIRGVRLWEFLTGELSCLPPPSALAQPVIMEKLRLLRRRCLLQIMMISCLRMGLSFVHIGPDLMRMLGVVQLLWPVWRIDFLLRLWSLSRLIRCGLFFTITMSPEDSLLFLLLFIKSSFFAKVMLPLMISLINFVLFDVRPTLLVLSCLMPPVGHARIRRLPLSFIARITY